MYRFTKEGMTSVLLLSALPILVFCLLCAITKTHILSSRYFRHLCLIYLYCFIGFIIYFVSQNTQNLISQEILGYMLLVPLFIFLGLVFYQLLNLIGWKSYLNRHDGICLLWCFILLILLKIDNPIFLAFYRVFYRLPDWIGLIGYYSLLVSYLILTPLILLHHGFYFLRLFWKEFQKQATQKSIS